MRYRNFIIASLLFLGIIPFISSCGSSVDSSSPKQEDNVKEKALKFVQEQEIDSIGPGSVFMRYNPQGSDTGTETVAIDIAAHQTGTVFGAAFDVEFDPNMLQYLGNDFGPFFECDISSLCQVKLVPGDPARLVIATSLSGDNVTSESDGSILTLKFKVVGMGDTPVTFKGNSILDASLKTVKINWYGGKITKS